MRMPWAPSRIADCTARFMARRKATRRSSCWAMFSAISVASISGLRILDDVEVTRPLVIFARSLRSFDVGALLADDHARAGGVDRDAALLGGRSMTIFAIPPGPARSRRNFGS